MFLRSFCLFAFLTLFPFQCSGQYSQRAKLFSGMQWTGSETTLIGNDYRNLDHSGFSQKAYSACIIGTWIFYERPDYNLGAVGRVHWHYAVDGKQKCFNFGQAGGRIQSARPVGDEEQYMRDSITLYEGTTFTGTQEMSQRDLPYLRELRRGGRSLIVTGSHPWTVYTLPNYLGGSKCVYPDGRNGPYVPAFIQDLSSIGLGNSLIQSAQKGCRMITTTSTIKRQPPARRCVWDNLVSSVFGFGF